VAGEVMRMPDQQAPRACACGGSCPGCQKKRLGNARGQTQLSRFSADVSTQGVSKQGDAPPIVDEVLRSPGQALDQQSRAFMEPRFGFDFSQVRVHADARAAESAEALLARAYTVGRHIVMGAASGTADGAGRNSLMAHELTHVVQQSGGSVLLQRSPAPKAANQPQQDVSMAKRRGSSMAARIRHHGKLSKEARDKVNRELAYFEGAAKDAYLHEVTPALRAVVEIEMPAEDASRPVAPPPPHTLMPLDDDPTLCGGHKCLTDEELGIPAPRDPAKEETQLRKDLNLQVLDNETADWLPTDKAFAVALLAAAIENHVNPKKVGEAVRQPILDRYLEWMKRVDQKRQESCDPNRGGIATARATVSNDDPCKSWFSAESGHVSHELQMLKATLQLTFDENGTPADQVYFAVFEYRRQTDPKMLESLEFASEMVGGAVAAIDGINMTMGSTPSKLSIGPEVEPPPNVGGGTALPESQATQGPTATTAAAQGETDALAGGKGAGDKVPSGANSPGFDEEPAAAKGAAKPRAKPPKAAKQHSSGDGEPDRTTVSAKQNDKGKSASAPSKGSKQGDAASEPGEGKGSDKAAAKNRRVVTTPEKTPAEDEGSIGNRSGPISPSEERIRTIAGKKIYVGMRAKIKMKGGKAVANPARNTKFDQLDPERAAAIGKSGTGRAAQLPDVPLPKHAGAKAGSQPSAGFVIEPAPGADSLEVVAWNTGKPLKETNISHAERQFIDWFRSQGPEWTDQVESVEVDVFGRDICMNCDADLQDLRKGFEHVDFQWNRTDTGHPYQPH
jgi:hypothetical protein